MSDSELLAHGAELGERFVAVLGQPPGPQWITAPDLFGRRLPAVLAAVVQHRGTPSPAVAAALLFEQYTQRLVAPVLAALLRDNAVVDVRPALVRAELVDGALRRIAFATRPTPAREDPEQTRARVAQDLVATHLYGVADVLHAETRLGRRVLHGAIANAIANALLHLSWPQPNRARHVPDAHAFLACTPSLAELVTIASIEIEGERWMYTDRNTCCLAFRTTVNQGREQRYCATCPLIPRSETRALFIAATASYAARHLR